MVGGGWGGEASGNSQLTAEFEPFADPPFSNITD